MKSLRSFGRPVVEDFGSACAEVVSDDRALVSGPYDQIYPGSATVGSTRPSYHLIAKTGKMRGAYRYTPPICSHETFIEPENRRRCDLSAGK